MRNLPTENTPECLAKGVNQLMGYQIRFAKEALKRRRAAVAGSQDWAAANAAYLENAFAAKLCASLLKEEWES